MEVNFKAIAFELSYSSMQIDAIYAGLGMLNSLKFKISVADLNKYNNNTFLPSFTEWIQKADKKLIIVFDKHFIPVNENFNDWELLQY